MKKFWFALALGILLALPYSRVELFAPELFSHGVGYGLATEQREFYIIHADWGTTEYQFIFLMHGQRTGEHFTGVIYQVLGSKIASYAPYECSTENVYCYKRINTTNWRGWIEFRGQKRPLCGGEKIKDKCLKLEF